MRPAANSHVSAGFLRDRIRNQPVDEPVAGPSVPERAQQQWKELNETLRALGATVELMEPQPGLPDLVFTANAGLVFGERFFQLPLPARGSGPPRQPHFDAWFAAHGFTVEHLPDEMYFRRRRRRALFCGQTLFRGLSYPQRTSRATSTLGQLLGRLVLPLELVKPALLPSRQPASARWAPGEAIYFPARVRRLRTQSDRRSRPRGCWRWKKRRRSASPATPSSSVRR